MYEINLDLSCNNKNMIIPMYDPPEGVLANLKKKFLAGKLRHYKGK